MNPLSLILFTIIYKPIFNLIVILLAIFGGNLGLSIIGLTLIIRFLLLKPSLAASNMQKGMVDIQPRLKELQEKYKDNPQKLGEETMKLFKTSGNNPLKGCKMTLIQIPVFIGLFYVIKDFAENTESADNIYSFLVPFVKHGFEHLNNIFLGIDLFSKGGISGLILAIIAGIFMYLQIKLTTLNKPQTPTGGMQSIPGMPKMPDINKMMGFMNMFMILMIAIFVYTMPYGIGLYIITSGLFTIIQYSIQYKELLKIKFKMALSFKK